MNGHLYILSVYYPSLLPFHYSVITVSITMRFYFLEAKKELNFVTLCNVGEIDRWIGDIEKENETVITTSSDVCISSHSKIIVVSNIRRMKEGERF